MKTQTIQSIVYTCENCGKKHTEENEISKCDMCKSIEICTSCKSWIYNITDNDVIISTFSNNGINAVCEACRQKIDNKINGVKEDLNSWINKESS